MVVRLFVGVVARGIAVVLAVGVVEGAVTVELVESG